MRSLRVVVVTVLPALALFLAACGDGSVGAARPMPSWFAIGQEWPRLGDARDAQSSLLDVEPHPRWFMGFSRPATADDDARDEARGDASMGLRSLEELEPGQPRRIPTVLTLPDKLRDLARSAQGARLDLRATVLPDSGDLALHLALSASERAIWREVEHRWTNCVPFLFGFYADGKPLRIPFGCSAKCGGSISFARLVEPGGTRTWTLRVSRASLASLLGGAQPKTLEIVATFSERQHAGYAVHGHALLHDDAEPPFEGEQILLRSGMARVAWSR